MSTQIIQTLLDAQVQTISGLPVLQTENNRLNATTNLASFVRTTLLPAASSILTLGSGANAMRLLTGLYQVDVFYPLDTGSSAARTLADTVVSTFPTGLRLTQGAVTVAVEVASVMTAYSINKYYCVPVRVQWTVYL
jgi:hypothetical protein